MTIKVGDKLIYRGSSRLGKTGPLVEGATYEVTEVIGNIVGVAESGASVRQYPFHRDDLCREFESVASEADVKTYVADTAKNIVGGVRRADYGPPENNFERIARFWQAYFLNTGREIELTAADVSPMMRLMKEARICETPDHMDSHVDLVGYALTGAEVNNAKIPIDGLS